MPTGTSSACARKRPARRVIPRGKETSLIVAQTTRSRTARCPHTKTIAEHGRLSSRRNDWPIFVVLTRNPTFTMVRPAHEFFDLTRSQSGPPDPVSNKTSVLYRAATATRNRDRATTAVVAQSSRTQTPRKPWADPGLGVHKELCGYVDCRIFLFKAGPGSSEGRDRPMIYPKS